MPANWGDKAGLKETNTIPKLAELTRPSRIRRPLTTDPAAFLIDLVSELIGRQHVKKIPFPTDCITTDAIVNHQFQRVLNSSHGT